MSQQLGPRGSQSAQPARSERPRRDREPARGPASGRLRAASHAAPHRRRSRRPRRRSGGSGSRAAWALIIGFVATVALGAAALSLLGTDGGAGATPTATRSGPDAIALDMAGFDVGRIIDDAVFYDSTTMTAQEVEDFIVQVNEGCRTGSDGTACLAGAAFDTQTQDPTTACPGGYTGAQGESAAQIVSKVATACDINPRVILVLLQKEQGLLTASGRTLTATDYEAATGYACPDGGQCDPAYAGFFLQVYSAASQFQRYRLDPAAYEVVAGVETTLAYSPDATCGTTTLLVANQATAGLYDYTPYAPNAAAAGGGDDCTSWGNWTFYGYFQTLFGDPTPSGAAATSAS